MNDDEQAIRSIVATWFQATAAGDLPRVLELMADDVVFLRAGQPPMRGKEAFAAAFRAMGGQTGLEGTADIQEIRVFGDWAYLWNQLTVTVGGATPARMTGPVLSVLRKESDGHWVLFRDANMLGRG